MTTLLKRLLTERIQKFAPTDQRHVEIQHSLGALPEHEDSDSGHSQQDDGQRDPAPLCN
jgi:hypothetical protein